MERILKLLKYLFGDRDYVPTYWRGYDSIDIDYNKKEVRLFTDVQSRQTECPEIFLNRDLDSQKAFEKFLEYNALQIVEKEMRMSYLENKLGEISC